MKDYIVTEQTIDFIYIAVLIILKVRPSEAEMSLLFVVCLNDCSLRENLNPE